MSAAAFLALASGCVAAAALRPASSSRPGADEELARRTLLTASCLGVAAVLATRQPLLAAGVALVVAGALELARASATLRLRATRAREVERVLPDALDLLAGVVEAGAPLDRALAAVAARARGALGDELVRCCRALERGERREDAFSALGASGSADLARVGAALAAADTLGSPVAERLREQAAIQRELRRLRVRERAAAAAPKISLVVGFVLVPAALLVVLGAQALGLLAGLAGDAG